MYSDYKVQNNDLKNMLVKKANDLHIPLDRLIWNYVNRGLMGDNMSDEKFKELHSEVFLKEVNDALGLD